MPNEQAQIEFVCPFCSRKCFACASAGDDGLCFVQHQLPACKKFDDLEPDEYLHQVNIQYGMHN